MERQKRRLAAILAADVVGYSRLMERDEAGTFAALKAHRAELIDPTIAGHGGRLVKATGDGLLAEFPSAVEAVRCAVEIQRAMAERNAGVPQERRFDYRIGVNVGDVMVEGDDIHGDGVNVAARLEALAEPGAVYISRQAYDQVEAKLDLACEDLGELALRNIARPVGVYRIGTGTVRALRRRKAAPRTVPGALIGLVGLALLAAAGAWYASPDRGGAGPGLAADAVLALPIGPSIAVLPFANMSADPADRYFSDGLAEDIISALSRFSDLRVIARGSTFQFRGRSLDLREVGRRLGARYVLEGSVRRSQDRLRVTAQLIDAADGSHLWAQTFDRDLTAADVFSVQDEITAQVAAVIGSSEAPLWRSRISQELADKRPESLAAYECVLLSYVFYDSFSPEAHARARDCLERAVGIEPDYSLAWSRLAFMYLEETKYGYNLRPEPVERALRAAQKAIELDPRNQDGYYALAMVRYLREDDLGGFRAMAERAIELNPNNAWVLIDIGQWTAYSGDFERGMALIRKGMALNPLYPSWVRFVFFLDHYRKGEYRDALAEALATNLPQNHMVQAALAAVYGRLGESDKARATLDHVLAIYPDFARDPRAAFVTRRMPPELVESIMDGLRKAGFEVASPGGA